MKRKILVLMFTFIFSINLIGCSDEKVKIDNEIEISSNEEANTIVDDEKNIDKDKRKDFKSSEYNTKQYEINEGDNMKEVSYKLFDSIETTDNLMISPLSLNLALGMLANGAEGDTRLELEKYLCNSIDEYNQFSKDYESTDELKIANAAWVSDEFKDNINDNYRQELKDNYNAKFESLNFLDPESVNIINNWCSENTNNLIPEIISNLNPEQKMILTNALYFKAAWEEEFKESDTFECEFTNLDGSKSIVDMMCSEEGIYYENDYAIGFRKDYKDSKYSFIGILPKDEGEFKLTDLDLESFFDSMSYGSVYIRLPKFKSETSLSLVSALQALGLNDIFSADTQLTGLIDGTSLYVDDILQKTYIDVNEKGTEAAAVTAIVMKNTAYHEPIRIFLDRPFAYMIIDNETDTILFLGKINNL